MSPTMKYLVFLVAMAAGGLVFFDKGEASDGWQYMEAAPAETEMLAKWGTTGLMVETSIELGSGDV